MSARDRPRTARLADWLSPPWCLSCRSPLGGEPSALLLCSPCGGKLRPLDARRHCRCCLRPLETAGREPRRCLGCRAATPALDRLIAAWWYEGPLRDVLRRLKFGRLEFLARPLVDAAIGREISTPLESVDLVAPVPLALWRRWSRGFNQAESLARPLAARLGRPLLDGLVRRLPVSPRQARLGRARRLRILDAGFRLRERARERVAGNSILLVDDIVTTGATLAAAAAVLRRAGAREVLAFAVAATPAKGGGAASGRA